MSLVHTKFSNSPFSGVCVWGGDTTIEENWLYEVRTIHYIVILSTAIFQGCGGGGVGEEESGRNHLLEVIISEDDDFFSIPHADSQIIK